MKQASNELKLFFKDYLADVAKVIETGMPPPKYPRYFGLCNALGVYASEDAHSFLSEQLSELFLIYCGNVRYPFGQIEYRDSFHDKNMHLDQNRLNFCRDAISDSLVVGKYTPKDRLPTGRSAK